MILKKFTFIALAIVLYGLSITQVLMAQAPDWTRILQVNANSETTVNLVTADANNVYMTCKVSGPITLDGVNYTSIGLNDMLLVKMNNSGVTEWVKQFNAQSGGSIIPNAIKTDASGNIYVATTFIGTIDVGGIPITSSTAINSIFSMFDTSGKLVWATPFFSNGTGSSKIALDTNGNSFLLSKTIKLLKFNHSGLILWEQTYKDKTLQAIAVSGSNLYLGGALQDQVTHFGTVDLTKLGGTNTGFLVKADLDGVYSNGIVVGGSITGRGSVVSDIAADNSGNLIITGVYTKDLVLGEITISNPSKSYYTYIAKCDNNLNFAWAKSSLYFYNYNLEMYSYRIFLDNSNNIYAFGMIFETITFGEIELRPKYGNQYLFKFDENGNALNGYALQNASFDKTIVSQSGKVLVGGTINAEGSTSYGNLFLTQFSNNLSQDWQKISSKNQTGDVAIRYIKHDAAGNIYLQSRVIGNCDYFGTIINTSSYLTVISKHDIAGKLLWMNVIADINPVLKGPGFILDKDNNVLTVGLFETSLKIGTTTLTSTIYGNEGYVAKYNSSGDFLWAAKMDLNIPVSTNISVAADNDGNVLIVGVIDPNTYLVKFDVSGNQLWDKTFPIESNFISFVSTDANNNIYITSEIHLSSESGSTTIGTLPFTQTNDDGATALIKFDPNGNALWAKTYGGVPGASFSDGWPCDIKTDATGNSYLWGWCKNNAIFGNTTLTNPFATNQDYSFFLTKINTSGFVVWAKAVYETKYAFNSGDLLDLDKNGNVYIGGYFKDKISIEGNEYVPEGTNDFFAVKYSSTGNFQWIKTIPANTDIIKAFSVKDNDVLSVAGYAGINSTLGSFNMNRMSGSNCLVATLGNLTTGISETKNSNISVFPNPVSTTLFLSGLTQNSTVSVFDLNGKLLINKSVYSNQVDVSNLANGFYTIRIVDKNRITTKTFVKQ